MEAGVPRVRDDRVKQIAADPSFWVDPKLLPNAFHRCDSQIVRELLYGQGDFHFGIIATDQLRRQKTGSSSPLSYF